jgi:hypothetical protein
LKVLLNQCWRVMLSFFHNIIIMKKFIDKKKVKVENQGNS